MDLTLIKTVQKMNQNRRWNMAGPSFQPDEYQKLSKAKKIIYWALILTVFILIFYVWTFKLKIFG